MINIMDYFNSSSNSLSSIYSNLIKKYNHFSESIEDEFLLIIHNNNNNYTNSLKELNISRNDIINKYNSNNDIFMVKLNEFRLQLVIHFEIILSSYSDSIHDIPNNILKNIIDILDYLSFNIDLVEIDEFFHPEESRLFLYYIKHIITPKYIHSLPSTLSYLYNIMEIDEYLPPGILKNDNAIPSSNNNHQKTSSLQKKNDNNNDLHNKPSSIAHLLLKMNNHDPSSTTSPSLMNDPVINEDSFNSNHNDNSSPIEEDKEKNKPSLSNQNDYQFKIPSADDILRKGINNTSIKINSNLQKKSVILNRNVLQLMRKRKSVYTNELSYQPNHKKHKKM